MINITPKKYLTSIFFVIIGSILSPISNTVEFLKGSGVFIYSRFFTKKPYTIRNILCKSKLPLPKGDLKARLFPFTLGAGRLCGILLTTLCIVGFIGTLAVPIPGISPIYSLSVIAIAKAYGVTVGWTLVSRLAGSLIGSIMDSFFNKPLFNMLFHTVKPVKKEWPTTKTEFILKASITVGLVGENFPALGYIFGVPINLFQEQLFRRKFSDISLNHDEDVNEFSEKNETDSLFFDRSSNVYLEEKENNNLKIIERSKFKKSHQGIKKNFDKKEHHSNTYMTNSFKNMTAQFDESNPSFNFYFNRNNQNYILPPDTGIENPSSLLDETSCQTVHSPK